MHKNLFCGCILKVLDLENLSDGKYYADISNLTVFLSEFYMNLTYNFLTHVVWYTKYNLYFGYNSFYDEYHICLILVA